MRFDTNPKWRQRTNDKWGEWQSGPIPAFDPKTPGAADNIIEIQPSAPGLAVSVPFTVRDVSANDAQYGKFWLQNDLDRVPTGTTYAATIDSAPHGEGTHYGAFSGVQTRAVAQWGQYGSPHQPSHWGVLALPVGVAYVSIVASSSAPGGTPAGANPPIILAHSNNGR